MEATKPFTKLMMHYRCAMLEIKTKLDVLNNELSLESERNPFESIVCRLKSPMSIFEKLERKNFPLTAESIENNIFDVAGIRVICSFPSDIYRIAEKLALELKECADEIEALDIRMQRIRDKIEALNKNV